MGPLLEARSLSKNFGAFGAVKDISLKFEPGRIHAVLGENGAGKSTLMKLLFGLLQPTSGEISLNGETVHWRSSMDAIARGLGMVQQHFTLVETLSVIDNIMLGAEVCGAGGRLRRSQAIKHLEAKLPSRHLALPWNACVSDLSVGEKQRLEILKLLFRDSQILFLDEPTAVLAPAEIEEFFVVLRQLKAQGRTIILITHKINEVLQVCDTYSVLRHGELRVRGNVPGTSVESIVEAMIGHRISPFEVAREPVQSSVVFEGHNMRGGEARLRGVDLRVNAGEIVGVAGVEGSGQSQLVEMIMGLMPFEGRARLLGEPLASTVRTRELGTGLIPEDRLEQGLWRDENSFHNMIIGFENRFTKYNLFNEKAIEEVTSKWAKSFDVRSASLAVAVGSLSGGNQQKLIFAREVFGREPRFLICHQPTRGVDLGAIDLIHRKIMELRNRGVGVLLISSELDELLTLSDRLYVFFSGQVSAEFSSRAQFDRARIGEAMTGMHRAH